MKQKTDDLVEWPDRRASGKAGCGGPHDAIYALSLGCAASGLALLLAGFPFADWQLEVPICSAAQVEDNTLSFSSLQLSAAQLESVLIPKLTVAEDEAD